MSHEAEFRIKETKHLKLVDSWKAVLKGSKGYPYEGLFLSVDVSHDKGNPKDQKVIKH